MSLIDLSKHCGYNFCYDPVPLVDLKLAKRIIVQFRDEEIGSSRNVSGDSLRKDLRSKIKRSGFIRRHLASIIMIRDSNGKSSHSSTMVIRKKEAIGGAVLTLEVSKTSTRALESIFSVEERNRSHTLLLSLFGISFHVGDRLNCISLHGFLMVSGCSSLSLLSSSQRGSPFLTF